MRGELARRHGAPYGWGGYDAGYSYYPYSYGYSGSITDPYTDVSTPAGLLTDPETSGSSDRSSTSSPGSGDEESSSSDQESSPVDRPMGQARRAFQSGDYDKAQKECEGAIRLTPGDTNLYEFRALCQLAQGKYQETAATLYDVLSAKSGWDWDTLSSFYPNERTYTKQLRALERYVTDNPKDAAGRFVLAYHYVALDERDAAADQLRQVVKLQPNDHVAPVILAALEK
jgi:tetratricopeptide (TPR) repeat protein